MISTKMKYLMSVIAALLFTITTGNAQSVVMLKGKITNNVSAKKVELTFKDESGASVRASSAADGSYQTVLKAGKTYNVVIVDENLQRFTFKYSAPAGTKYAELLQDFSLAPTETAVAPASVAKSKKKTKSKKSTKGK